MIVEWRILVGTRLSQVGRIHGGALLTGVQFLRDSVRTLLHLG